MPEQRVKDKLIGKLKAFSIHLSISAIIFLFILYLIFYEWYPEPFFTAQGGWKGIKLMAVVDLVLGPMLTLIIFNITKHTKEIVFDLSMIAIVQITALLWGGGQVYSQRPVALVFWGDAFYTVTSSDYTEQGIEVPDFSKYNSHVPPIIFSKPVSTIEEYEELNELTDKKIPAYAHVSTYRSVEDNLEQITGSSINVHEIILMNDRMAVKLEKITSGDYEAYFYLPLKAKYQNMILVMAESGEIVGEVTAPAYSF